MEYLTVNPLSYAFSICQTEDFSQVNLETPFCFAEKTDEEHSLVCRTTDVPPNTIHRDDGWRAFRIQGTLDFSLIGILAKISNILAENKIGIFAISTYNTDYILTRQAQFQQALQVLQQAGYQIKPI